MIKEDYYGRLLTEKELPGELVASAQAIPAFYEIKGNLHCQRCGTAVDARHLLPSGAYYCRECLIFGRNQTDRDLYVIAQQDFPAQSCLTWQGQLTDYQSEVSQALLHALDQRENILVHAVTGAGKTEMIYETVARVIDQGGAVALVSPRIDVCKELYARLQRDFSCDMVLLHGESEPYHRAPLVIATVHQLYKFYQAFDLILIDEVDAFPYVDNPSLYHAVANAKKPDGLTFFLTATSTDALDKEVKSGRLKQVHLARRFHGNPLVVPETRWLSGLNEGIAKGYLPKPLLHYIQSQRQTGYPLLIFFPHIEIGQQFTALLKAALPSQSIGFVSSKTEERSNLVDEFRQKKLDILVSTTILERGVTFPCVDVIVLWANHRLYTRSSLVQIGGRVGRSMDRPTGDLIFFHDGLTKAIKQAIREIKGMNQKGGF